MLLLHIKGFSIFQDPTWWNFRDSKHLDGLASGFDQFILETWVQRSFEYRFVCRIYRSSWDSLEIQVYLYLYSSGSEMRFGFQ